MSQEEYALCRAVADGWLVLDRGPLHKMDEARTAVERRELANEGRYVVMHTAVAVGEIAGADGLPPDDHFEEFMRKSMAAPPRPPRKTKPDRDGAKQLMLLGHLKDKPGQITMFEEVS